MRRPQIIRADAGVPRAAPQAVLCTINTLVGHNDFVCDGTDCAPRKAIQAANNTATKDTLDGSEKGTINLLSILPDISGSVAIERPGAGSQTMTNSTMPRIAHREARMSAAFTIPAVLIWSARPTTARGSPLQPTSGGQSPRRDRTADRRVTARVDNSARRGAASRQILPTRDNPHHHRPQHGQQFLLLP
jgi:hypothetical protein